MLEFEDPGAGLSGEGHWYGRIESKRGTIT